MRFITTNRTKSLLNTRADMFSVDATNAHELSALITPVWQRRNYVNKSTTRRHFQRMAQHPDPEQRVCKFSHGSSKFFDAAQVLEVMTEDLQLHLGPGPGAAELSSPLDLELDHGLGRCIAFRHVL